MTETLLRAVHPARTLDLDEMETLVGHELGVSGWHEVTQALIDCFAAATGDDQFIHVDPARAAAETPFGTTIAHGFLTLSLLSTMGREAIPSIRDRAMGINYGFERVRFLQPVTCGSQVRGRFVLKALERRPERRVLLRYDASVEIEGADKPALAAEWLTMAVMKG